MVWGLDGFGLWEVIAVVVDAVRVSFREPFESRRLNPVVAVF
jgi:hypothetical protein